MRLLLLACLFFSFSLFAQANPKKRRVFKRKLAVSVVSAYTFSAHPKKLTPDAFNSPALLPQKPLFGDSQIESIFSALEISRNFGSYEVGARIQNTFGSFVSPFFKWNAIKNYSHAQWIPSVAVGVSPSSALLGSWLRLSLGVSLNRYLSLEPFLGTYIYYKIRDDYGPFEKWNSYFHAGLRVNLYY